LSLPLICFGKHFAFLCIFNRILMMQAYQNMGQGTPPKITVIIAQKNHHIELFQPDAPGNIPPGLSLSSIKQS
jgi:hypothetical protein